MNVYLNSIAIAAAYLFTSSACAAQPAENQQASAVTSRLAADMDRAREHADVRHEAMRRAGERMKADTNGMSLDEMRNRYNQRPKDAPCDAEPCTDHSGHQHGAIHDRLIEPPIEGGLCNPDQHG